MSTLKFIKYIACFLVLLLLVPVGVESLYSTIVWRQSQENVHNTGSSDESYVGFNEEQRLNNPNAFNREFEICSGTYDSKFYSVEEHSSYIRDIYDKYGIQIYLLTYSIDYSNGINRTKQETKEEINAWIDANGKDPYGIYYVLSGYDREWSDVRFKEDGIYKDYHKSVVDGYRVYGSEVDKWWSFEVQQAFEKEIEKCDYYIEEGSNCYKDFVKALSGMKLDYSISSKIEDITGATDTEDDGYGIFAAISVFTIFSVLPIGIVVIIISKDIKKARQEKRIREEEEARRQYEETQRILNTPIKTLEEEYAEELKDEYTK